MNLTDVIHHIESLFPDGVQGRKVLDAGCGSGIVSMAFAKLGGDVTGIDASERCVELSRARAKQFGVRARFERHDLTTLHLGDSDFDIIYSWGVLHHTKAPKESFHRLVSVLKPGGTIVIAVYLKTWLSGFWNCSRLVYQYSPKIGKSMIIRTLSIMLNSVDTVRKRLKRDNSIDMRGTDNDEIINDWFGVPQRSFHTYQEVFDWFRTDGLRYKLTNPFTGRFKSTSNFEVMGWKSTPIESP